MIITISGANFSLSNIGTLSTWTVSKSIGAGAEHSIPSYVDKNSAFNYTITLKDGYTFGTYSVTMGGQTITPTVTETSITINIPSVTGAVRIEVKTINSSTGEEDKPVTPPVTPEEPGTGGESGDSGNREFTLTSSMLTNQTYSTSTSSWKDSTKHLGTGFMTLYSGYDVVFDLPDTMEGYLAHLYQEKDGTTSNNKISLLSSWVQKGIVSTGPTSDKYFIVIQKKSKATITSDEYASIVGSIKVQKPTSRTITLDNTLMNAGKGYMAVNIIDDADRMASWFYALTPGSTVSGNIADGLQAYIMSIKENDKEFSVDTTWVSSFNQTYNEACSIYIVAKYTDGSDFVDTSSWTSPLTINIK